VVYQTTAFLDHDLAANGQLVAARGGKVYGIVISADPKSLAAELTDIQIGDRAVSITTQPLRVQGSPAVITAQTLQPFTLAQPFQVNLMTNVAVR
jgi:hypothetical protein